jgi:parvulin-like peptidyl-prolyl isomerase
VKILVLALAIAGLLPVACQRQRHVSSESQPKKEALVAIINGREIAVAAFDDYVKANELESEAHDPESRRAIFEEFVIEQLLIQAAAKEKIELSDDELRLYLEEWRKAGEVSQSEPPRLHDYLRAQKLIRQKIAQQVQVKKEEMERYYADHKVDFVVDDQVHVLEILVDREDKASEIRSRLRPRDFRGFRQQARQHSQGLTAADGGDLGTFERGQLPEEFERVIFVLKPGGVSQVFRSEHGFHIFMLEEFIPRHPQEFHEVQTQIFENLLGEREREATDRYLAQLKRQASIEVLDPNLKVNWRDNNVSGN